MRHFKIVTMFLAAAFMILFASATVYADAQYFCNGKVVNAGETKNQVLDTLGKPSQTQENTSQSQNTENDETSESVTTSKWTYMCDGSTYIFLFQNNVLISIYQIAGAK